jgi:hypothetical protein
MLQLMSTIHSLFQVTSLHLISLCLLLIFSWLALGEVDLHFSFTWVTKANVCEGRTTSVTRLYHQRNQLKHVMDGLTVTSLSASLQHMVSVAMDRP